MRATDMELERVIFDRGTHNIQAHTQAHMHKATQRSQHLLTCHRYFPNSPSGKFGSTAPRKQNTILGLGAPAQGADSLQAECSSIPAGETLGSMKNLGGRYLEHPDLLDGTLRDHCQGPHSLDLKAFGGGRSNNSSRMFALHAVDLERTRV